MIISPYINETTPGNFRVVSFIEKLRANNNRVYVINTRISKKENGVFYYKVEDKTSIIFGNTSQWRNNPIFKTFILPLLYLNWIFECFLLSSNLIREKKIEIIFTSYRPPQVIILGFFLKLVFKKCNLITEYRDSWTDNPYTKFPSHIVKKITEIVEYHILDKSDYIIVVSITEKNRFLKKYNHISEKISIIKNGFYESDIEKIESDNFIITHSGSFYGSRQPDNFIKAYKLFLNKYKKSNIRLKFIGKLDETNIQKINRLNISKNVDLLGNLNYKESLSNIYNSDVLLFIEYTDSMTTKIYDYISSGNPIIVLSSNVELIKFVSIYSPHSIIITDNSTEKIIESLEYFYNKWKKGDKPIFDKKEEYYKKYTRENIAEKLLKLI